MYIQQDELPTLNSKALIDEAIETLASKYDEMFKPSQNCRPPHVNIDVLRDEVYQSGFVLRKGVKTSAELLAAIEAVNDSFGTHLSDPSNQEAFKGKALDKAIKYKFYLGIMRSWMYNA